jgi:response regulator RpfG family c-di-GMP phosphodiesterase
MTRSGTSPGASVRSPTDTPSSPVTLGASAATLGAALLARERRGRRRAERLAAALSETLLNAINATDSETGAHVRRVARYALILAEANGADHSVQHEIERVALFHDIGKIHEALFDIIHERTRLTSEERQAIATHPARGAAVLAPLADFYPDLPAGVLAHHERWDGTGYPQGLSGTRIPYAARVVAVADSFDAVTHHRRYSRARGFGDAVAAIEAGRGTQFDPQLVDCMVTRDVLHALAEALRRAYDQPARRDRRRPPGTRLTAAPDVSFRWRPEELSTAAALPTTRGRSRPAARARQTPGPVRQKSPR